MSLAHNLSKWMKVQKGELKTAVSLKNEGLTIAFTKRFRDKSDCSILFGITK